MNFSIERFSRSLILPAVAVLLTLNACSKQGTTLPEQNFIGKWKSSKADTAIVLYANGEWEVQSEGGGILQYGVWQLAGPNIMWSYKNGPRIEHDINRVLSTTPGEFKVQEQDRTTTTFIRLEQGAGS